MQHFHICTRAKNVFYICARVLAFVVFQNSNKIQKSDESKLSFAIVIKQVTENIHVKFYFYRLNYNIFYGIEKHFKDLFENYLISSFSYYSFHPALLDRIKFQTPFFSA